MADRMAEDRELERRERELADRERDVPFAERERVGRFEREPRARDDDMGTRDRVPAGYDRHDAAGREREGNGAAIAAAVLGAIGLLALVLTIGGLFIVALPLGLAAMWLGSMGRRKVDRGLTHSGRGAARAGWIMGLITTVLSVVVALLILVGALALGGLTELQREAEQQQQQQDR